MAEENAGDGPEFDGGVLAKDLLRTIRSGALATLDSEGQAPFCSLVTVATDIDGTPLFLLSNLSAHTVNLNSNPRASLLLAMSGKGDPLAHPRITLTGLVERTDEPRIRRRFLARHPKAGIYADFPDFSFRRLAVESAHLNGGFARFARLSAAELLTDITGAAPLIEAEAGAVEHMNADHREAIRLYATRLAGAPDDAWRATGCDPEGIDMAAGDLTCRVRFPAPVSDGSALRRVLVDLAGEARGRDS